MKKTAGRKATRGPRGLNESPVERVYEQLKALAVSFEMPPGDRVNEIEIAQRLGVSRTPLREALNRLTADGFLTMTPGKGFLRRPLDPTEIFDLYELRVRLETSAVELAVARASDSDIDAIRAFLEGSSAEIPSRTINHPPHPHQPFPH